VGGVMGGCAVGVGRGRGETLVAVRDGGNGLERLLRQAVSGAVVCVLDWWHLSEKLHEVGRLLHEPDAGAARAWAEARETTLWEQGGQGLAEEMGRLGCPAGASAGAGGEGGVGGGDPWETRRPGGDPGSPGRRWGGRRRAT